jgi:hypothetical protein
VVDRYKAYQAIDKVKSGLIVLAFCSAHVRRDFVRLAKSWPDQESWALGWVDEIGTLYHLNDERLKLRDDAAAFAVADGALRAAVTSFGKRGEDQLREANVPPARQKVLESLGDHWSGLTVFVEHPEVPMDNNTAERSERGPVVGRKNYYGSGSVERPTGGDAVLGVPDAVPVWSEPPAVADGVPVSVCGSRGPGAELRRKWTDSCRGTSAPRRDASGEVTTWSQRRTRHSTTRESDSKPIKPAARLANPSFGLGECAPAERTGCPNLYTSAPANLSGIRSYVVAGPNVGAEDCQPKTGPHKCKCDSAQSR